MTYAATHPLTLLFTPLVAIVWMAWGPVFLALVFAAGLVMFPVWALGEKIAVEPAPAT